MKSSSPKVFLVASAGAALLALSCAAADPEPAERSSGVGGASESDATAGAPVTSAATGVAGSASTNAEPGVSATAGTGPTSVGVGGSSSTTSSSGGSLGVGGGSAGSNGSAPATFATVSALLANNCAGSKCHGGTAEVNFTTASGLYSRLTTPVASSIPHCAGTQLVAPGNTAGSFLLSVIQGKSTCKKGTGTESIGRMPDGCSTTSSNPRACLTTAQIQTVSAWVAAGAPQ